MTAIDHLSFSQRLALVTERMRVAAEKAGRDPTSVTLIAVSKGHPQDEVIEAMRCGQYVFGENRVKEAREKFSTLQKPPIPQELHLIGALQTNKADDAVRLFDVIQTVDRPSLAKALAASIQRTGRSPRLSIEVNSGLENQKAGIAPDDLSSFLRYCRQECGLSITGLMCIPPADQPPLPFFDSLKKMADLHDLPHISMGMSQDFDLAIAAGATEIRVGTALFGERRR